MELSLYIALNWTPGIIKDKGLQEVIPTRRCKFGARLGITSDIATGIGLKETEVDPQWIFSNVEPNEGMKRRMISAALEIAIQASFRLHVNIFVGKT